MFGNAPTRLVFLLLICASGSYAQDLLQNANARQTQSLDGDWHIIVDPYETGYYTYRYQLNTNGFFKDQKMQNPWDLIEYDFDTGPTLRVPGDWNTQDDQLFLYEGTVWYKQTFRYDPDPKDRTFVRFGAANYEAHIFLNGDQVGHHVGGFTPFDVEVTDHVVSGENTLIVKVDNKRRHDGIPTVNTDWWNYGGITRSVSLVTVPRTFIADYVVQLTPGRTDEISGWVQLVGEDAAGRSISLRIEGLGISELTESNEDGIARFAVRADPELWSPENPKLYEVVFEGEGERLSDLVGFRSVETRGEDILLNGKPVFLRGVSIHEERPTGGGRAFSEEHAETLLGWAKEMGCNFVRLAHYPHNQHMVRVADRLGLMVWSEVPVYWTVQFDNPEVYALAEQQVTEMVLRDRNRASVVLWSVANETPRGEARLAFLTNLAQKVRELDPSRLVTAALETRRQEDGSVLIDDAFSAEVDVVGINSYCGWYGSDLPDACADLRWVSKYNKPVIMSEFGGGALQGKHGTKLDRWTEEYQASVYANNLAMLEKIPFLRGTSPWILKDFRSPRRPLPEIQDFWNRKGLVSDDGTKKKAFFIMKEWYEGRRHPADQ